MTLVLASSCFGQAFLDIEHFIYQNKIQIRRKIDKSYWITFEDYCNEIFLFWFENGHKFNPSLGNQAQFVFGYVDRKIRRGLTDALSYASSIDEENDRGHFIRNTVESISSVSKNPIVETHLPGMTLPGSGDLASLADVISGKTAHEVALEMRLSKRAVNLKIASAKLKAERQFSIFSFNAEDL